MSDWQPIETAPKDGTEILAYRQDCDVFIARYTSADAFLGGNELEGMDEADIFAEGWFCADFVRGSRLDGAEMPTHWMPLPEPPHD